MLFHFSEDPSIAVFLPHVPRSNPSVGAAVWAIDVEHSPSYWLPRECPRVAVWGRDERERAALRETFGTASYRFHVIESAWMDRMRSCRLYRYTFDPEPFAPWPEAEGQHTAHSPVRPTSVEPVRNLIEQHEAAGIDLRTVDDLAPWKDLATRGPWTYSIIRYHNAKTP